MSHPDDTIVARSSADGGGRRGIVRLSGPLAFRIVDSIFQTETAPTPRTAQTGHLIFPELASRLPATVLRFPAPNSYTGQDIAEIHTLGSPPLLELLITACLNSGARAAQPGEFTQRAFFAGKKDLTRAEAVLGVIEANSETDLQTAITQLAGGIVEPVAALRNDLLNLVADVEAALDFVDEDLEFVSQTDTLLRISAGLAHLTNLQRQLRDRTISGRPMRVVFAGPPNAGKSSLYNALAPDGPAALVSAQAGTTRDYLVKPIRLGEVELELIDTAGLRDTPEIIETQSQQHGRTQAARADLVLWCQPANEPLTPPPNPSWTVLRTKRDLATAPSDSALSVSATTGAGLAEFRSWLEAEGVRYQQPALAPSQSRCRHTLDAAISSLRTAHRHALETDPPELLALELRNALHHIGTLSGAVYTNDLLDRIFSRFCIGK